MKIEIDFSKPESLRKQLRELEMAAATIKSALSAIDNVDQPSFPQIPATVDSPAREIDVASIIASFPAQFDMRQAKLAADAAEIPDSRLRREIAKMIESGALVMTEKGQGRRPANFRKA
jgi:hypothetical protein